MSDDDDLSSELFVPLLVPGTPVELAGEAAVLDAFRAARRDDLGRRRRRRAVIGSAGTLAFVLASGGVAAAYGGHLPAPLQGAVHDALGGVGVPAARAPRHPLASPHPVLIRPSRQPEAPRPTTAPSLRPTPSSRATTTPAATVPPTPAPQPTPSASPTPAATLTSSASLTTVPVHRGVTLRGTLTRGGQPVVGVVVYAASRLPGTTTWHRVGHATTDGSGQVAIPVKDLLQNVVLRLATGDRVVSAGQQVTVLPVVQATTSQVDARTRAIKATTDGAHPQDDVVLERRDGDTWKVIRTSTLNANAAVTFRVAAPAAGSSVRYRVRVKATSTHGVGLRALTLTG